MHAQGIAQVSAANQNHGDFTTTSSRTSNGSITTNSIMNGSTNPDTENGGNLGTVAQGSDATRGPIEGPSSTRSAVIPLRFASISNDSSNSVHASSATEIPPLSPRPALTALAEGPDPSPLRRKQGLDEFDMLSDLLDSEDFETIACKS